MNLEKLQAIPQGIEAWLGKSEIVAQNIEDWKHIAFILRENKLTQVLALKAIPKIREAAETKELWGDTAELYWEEYLVGKHFVMFAREMAWIQGSFWLQTQGLSIMTNSEVRAREIIDAHPKDKHIQRIKPRMGRFSGEVAMIAGDYQTAINLYSESIDLYEQREKPEERVNAIEIHGFAAEAEIRSGEVVKGIKHMKETYSMYEERDEAKSLRAYDWYTWIVWRSGCVIKASRALEDKGERIDNNTRLWFSNTIEELEHELQNPPTKVNGDTSIRLDEIKSIKQWLLR